MNPKLRWRIPKDVTVDLEDTHQVEACALWEYARESSLLCKLTAKLQNQMRPDPGHFNFQPIMAVGGANSGGLCGMLQNLACHGHFPTLASTSWHELPQAERLAIANHAYTIRDPVYPLPAGSLVQTSEQPSKPKYQTVALRIPWHEGLQAVITGLQCWALENCPTGTRPPKRGGRHSNPKQRAVDALRQLRALRLRSQLSYKPAVEEARRLLGREQDYTSPNAWKTAIYSAVSKFHELFGNRCGEPRSFIALRRREAEFNSQQLSSRA